MANNLIQDGATMTFTNAGAAIASGDPVDLSGSVGVAHADIGAGETGVLHMDGVWLLPKASGQALTAGQAVNLSGGEITGGAGTPAGLAWADAASGDATAQVKINAGVGAS